MREREIFIEARALDDPVERAHYLGQACGDDVELRRRIERLLAVGSNPGSMLDRMDSVLDREPVGEQPGDQVGPYRLQKIIGEGGFGVVFLAQQELPIHREVALKVIRPGMDSRQVIARFETERQTLALMDHPNIAKVLEAGTTTTGRPYFVMELIKGQSITEYCQQRRPTLQQRLELFCDLCHAIGHAHSKGIIHRDIKPHNVLVTVVDGHPTVKVIDFGVAKAVGDQWLEQSRQTAVGSVVGSLEYMSPEQASLNPLDIDTRSDIYSLGVLLYELLTGTPPLDIVQLRRAGLLESLRMIREQEPLRPSQRLRNAEANGPLANRDHGAPDYSSASIRGDLDWISLKAIDKDRDRRYQTAMELGEEVQRYLQGSPVLAHPPSAIYYVRKHIKRNLRVWILAGSMLVLMLLAIGWWSSDRYQRLQREQVHTQLVQAALSDANAMLVAAEQSNIGQAAPWTAARAAATRLQELVDIQAVEVGTQTSVATFLQNFQQLNGRRRLAEQIEQVVMMSATQSDLESWEQMDQQFQELFMAEGIDPQRQSPREIAAAILAHDSAAPLSDALELWIGTKGQISALGGKKATAESMQPLAEAMLAADSDPVRSGVRRLLYSGKQFTSSDVDAVVEGQDLELQSPRTLSWLATMYFSAGAHDAADRVFYEALDRYPDDFMLNFDFAYTLENQKRWPEAIRFFLRCTAMRPDVAGVWRGLGNAYQNNGETARAAEALAKAVRISPRHWPSRLDYGTVLLEQKQYPEAESLFDSALDLGCDRPQVFLRLAEARYHQQKYQEALSAIESCEAANLKNPRLKVDPTELKAKCQQALKP